MKTPIARDQFVEQKHKEKVTSDTPVSLPSMVEALRLSEEKYRTLVNHLNDGIFIIQDEKLQFINETFAAIIGYSVKEVLGKKFQEFVAPAYLALVSKRYQERQRGKKNIPKEYEIQIVKKDGTLADVLLSVGIITYKGSVASMGIVRDITERKKVEYNAKISELRYRRLFETAQDGILLIDFQTGMILDVNPFLIDMLGYSKADFLEKYLWEIGVFKDVAASKENFVTLQTKQYVRFEDLPLETKDGKKMEVEFVANAYHVDGTMIIQCNIRDITDRKKAERALAALSIRQKAVLDAIPDIIMEVNMQKIYVWSNQPGIDFFGDDVIGHPADYYFIEKQTVFDVVQAIFEGSEDTTYVESWQRRKDGEKRLLAWYCKTLKDEQGKVIGGVSSARDITDERETQLLLTEKEQLLRQVIDLVPHFIFAKDTESKFILVNKAVADAYGSTPQKLIGKSDVDFSATSEQARHFHEDDLSVINGAKPKFIPEETIKDTKGNTRYLQTTKIPFYINKGAAKGLLGVSVDITEQKKLQQKILEDKSKDEAILESIGDAVFACDQQGTIILFNGMAERISGVSSKDAVGHVYHEVLNFVKESTGKKGNDFVEEAIKKKKITKMENHTLLVRKDGRKIPVADSAAPIMNETGAIIGCVVVFHDMTHEYEIDKAKTEFVSLASHQLRTPLTTINWYSEMLMSDGVNKMTHKQQEYLQETHNASKRMVELIDALLNVSRLELGTFVIEPEEVFIQAIAKTCVDELQPLIVKRHVHVEELYDETIKTWSADPKLLSIILSNLLSNAIKYTPADGSVQLHVQKKDETLVITVSDTGIGIPLAQQDKAYTKLFRADNAKTIDPDGTGLGLYIVHTIVTNSGGTIAFVSSEKGTTFTIQYPSSGMVKKAGTKQLV